MSSINELRERFSFPPGQKRKQKKETKDKEKSKDYLHELLLYGYSKQEIAVLRGIKKSKISKKYVATKKGDDAVLFFGKHQDRSISMIKEEEPSYLVWMLKQDFDQELLDIVVYHLDKD